MANWVDPEWLPTVPVSDNGPFHCYILWLKEPKQYYVGHSGKICQRLRQHFNNGVKSSCGYTRQLLWVSGEMASRTDAKNFEAALKSYVKSGNEAEFERCTGRYLVRGATLRE